MHDVMVDLETMSSSPRSAIVSIGAVRFDLTTGDVGDFMHEPVSLKSSIEAGLEISADTVLWWMKQSPEAQASWNVAEPKRLDSGLAILTRLVQLEGGAKRVFANAPTFDCAILRTAYGAVKQPVPWKYRQERCMRTLVDLASAIGFDPRATPREGTAHSALDDCFHQIEICCRAWRHLKGE